MKALSKLLDGQRVCRNCFARSAAVPCSRCGSVREPATRDADGSPLCPNCLISDPANLEECAACGRRSRVAVRSRRRAAMRELPAPPGPGLRDLRTDRAMRGIQGHRPAVVHPLPAVVGSLRRVRHRGPRPRRHPAGTVVRAVPQPRTRLLGPLPGLQGDLAAQHEAMPALHPRIRRPATSSADQAGTVRGDLAPLHQATALPSGPTPPWPGCRGRRSATFLPASAATAAG